ncbi:BRO1-like domain-containing protein [Gongronella butleri]|nr:BRO1-like domain-containing protein [Gongronella butleri]
MTQSQIPFLYVPLKRTDDIDWVRPLKRYIGQVYQQDPENYQEETYAIHRLRQDIRGAGKDLTGRDLVYRYFGQLELLDLRFPVDEKHIKVLFTWYDAFSGRPTSQYSLAFEKASVIFNLAATLSAIAAVQNRADADGRKRAFHFFQASAGMFQYINDNFLHAPSQDLHKDTVRLLMDLMLVQAQECFLENSVREKKKDALVAKLASHAVWTYGNLVDQINDAIGRGVAIDKHWLTFTQCKHRYYQALAHYHRAAACLLDHQYGEQVARLQCADRLAKDAHKLAMQLPVTAHHNENGNVDASSSAAAASAAASSWNAALVSFSSLSSPAAPTIDPNSTLPSDGGAGLQDHCANLAALCADKAATAERDNDMIYHDHTPQESILVPIDRLKAVQPVAISDVYGPADAAKVIGPDIFVRLVPLSVHETASLYSEEKANLVRREAERCDFAKAEVATSLEYMGLPAALHKFRAILRHQQPTALLMDQFARPPDTVNKIATDIHLQETNDRVVTLWDTHDALFRKNTTYIDQLALALDKEMSQCENMRVKYGEEWTQEPSSSAASQYRQDLKNHRAALGTAQASDEKIRRQWAGLAADVDLLKQGADSTLLETLFTDALAPSLAKPNDLLGDLHVVGNKELEQKIARVDALMEKLDKLQKDRESTLDDLKEKTHHDDITQLLLINKKNSNVEKQIFAAQLEKYQSHQQRISATLHEQQQTIQELTDAFKTLMDADDVKQIQSQWEAAERQQNQIAKRLINVATDYKQTKSDIKAGIAFYTELWAAVESLKVNVDRFLEERGKERDALARSIDDTRTSKEQQELKDRLHQYSMPLMPTAAAPAAPMTPMAPMAAPPPAQDTTTTMDDQTLRLQLEQKMKELSIAIPASSPQTQAPAHIPSVASPSPMPMSAHPNYAPPPPLEPFSQPHRQSMPVFHQHAPSPPSMPPQHQRQPSYTAPSYSQPSNSYPYATQPLQAPQQQPPLQQQLHQSMPQQPTYAPQQQGNPALASNYAPQPQISPAAPANYAPQQQNTPANYTLPTQTTNFAPQNYVSGQQPGFMGGNAPPATPQVMHQAPFTPMQPQQAQSAPEQKPMLPPKPLEVRNMMMAASTPSNAPAPAQPPYGYPPQQQQPQQQLQQQQVYQATYGYTNYTSGPMSPAVASPHPPMPPADYQWQQQQPQFHPQQQQQPLQQQQQQQPLQQQQQQQQTWPSMTPQPYRPNQPSLLD